MIVDPSPSAIPRVISNAPWLAKDLRAIAQQWIYHLNPAEIAEIEDALACLRKSTKPMLKCSPLDFPLPTLRRKLQRAVLICELRTGIFLFRGLPIERLCEEDARLLAWGMGLHVGVPLIQNAAMQLLVDVRARDIGDTLRNHTTSSAMEFHVDSCDLATLLCRRSAGEGGESRIANMLTIYNQMGQENIEWQKALHGLLPFASPVEGLRARRPYFLCPVFSLENGIFAARFYKERIDACRDLIGAPPLSDLAIEACEAFLHIADDPRNCIEFLLQPGDFQLLNNHVVCHARSSFFDEASVDRKRHLYRQWFATPFSRPLPESFRPAYGRVGPGTLRGGYRCWPPTAEVCDFQKCLGHFNGVKI